MVSLVLSTVVFFVASYFIRRYLDDGGVPPTFGRAVVVFTLALAAAYACAAFVDWIA